MKNKKLIIAVVLVLAAVVAAVLIFTKDSSKDTDPKAVDVDDIQLDASVAGLSVESMDNIAGLYVEDGSNEALGSIFTVTFRNNSDKDLQYAKLILTVGKEEYNFEISTLPAGESVRAMEMNRKTFAGAKGDVTLTQENIAWFGETMSMHTELFKITQRNNALILENVSGQTVTAPIYVYYKNYSDNTLIGGITYRAGTQQDLAPGKSVVLSAKHFEPDSSRLMFVSYGA